MFKAFLLRVLQIQLWQMLLWTFCVCWWKTNGAGCAQRTYRKPSGCSLGPSLRGRTVSSHMISIKFETYVPVDTFICFLLMSTIFCFRWLDVGVAHLTSAPCWVIYLQVLQEAVWPGGTLPVQPRPERSAAQRQEAKKQCLDCLMQLLPGSSLLLVWPLNPVCFCFCNLFSFFSWMNRDHYWHVGKREVQTDHRDNATVFTGPSDKQVSVLMEIKLQQRYFTADH